MGVGGHEVAAQLERVASGLDLGTRVGEATSHLVEVIASSGHEVRVVEVRPVGVGHGRASETEPRTVERGASARVHGAAEVPAGPRRS